MLGPKHRRPYNRFQSDQTNNRTEKQPHKRQNAIHELARSRSRFSYGNGLGVSDHKIIINPIYQVSRKRTHQSPIHDPKKRQQSPDQGQKQDPGHHSEQKRPISIKEHRKSSRSHINGTYEYRQATGQSSGQKTAKRRTPASQP